MKGSRATLLTSLLFAGLMNIAQADVEHIVLDSDGWEIHGVWQANDASAPAVLLLHAAAGDRSDFAALAEAASAEGLHVLQLELRGHGQSTNLGRFEPPYSENRHINAEAWHDIVAGVDWLRGKANVGNIAIVGASYSGEQAALALREGGIRADAYVMFSPGNFQDASIDAVDPSGVPWLFLRTEEESPASLRWIDEIYALLPERATTAEVITYPGAGHAADMFDGRPELAGKTARWIVEALTAERVEISRTSLFSTPALQGPVNNRYFMAIDSDSAKHQFNGAVRIPEHAMQTDPEALQPTEIVGKQTQLFPGVTVHFVSHGEFLLPVERDLLAPSGSDSFWQIQLSPGRVWSEEADDGLSRASFPFMLTSNIENETYNGIATFVFNDDGVSQLRYQVVQQLSPFLVETWFVAWGQVEVDYQRGGVDAEKVIAEFEQEFADRLVWRNWSELEEKFGKELLESFDNDIAAEKIVMDGLAIDGEIYLRSADTPYGPYPYPREMRHGIWSVSKTATGLVTLLRMAQKYGDEILDYKIADYLDVTATHDGWDEVTFADAMSMATGIGTGSNKVDPNDFNDGYIYSDFDEYVAWYIAPTLDEKLEHVFSVPSHPWGPGEHGRYRDRDTFTLAAALDALYREKEGDAADLWGMMIDEVYAPLGIHHMPMNLTKETDRPGVPLLGWGLYANADDIVKIARLLDNDGMHNGVQLLSKGKLAEALYQTEVRGLPTGSSNQFGENSYHLSVWHYPYETDNETRYSIPSMLGWGGIIVQIMPNGMIAFRFGNGGTKSYEQAIRIADQIQPFDEAGQ